MTNWKTASFVDCPFPNDLNPKSLLKSRQKLQSLDCFIENTLSSAIKADSFGKIEASLYKRPVKRESNKRVEKPRFKTTPVTFDEIQEVDEESTENNLDENANKSKGSTKTNPHTLPPSELHQKPSVIQRFHDLSRSNNNISFGANITNRRFSGGTNFLERYLPIGSPRPEFSGQISQHNPTFSPDSGPFPFAYISPSGRTELDSSSQQYTPESSDSDDQDSPQSGQYRTPSHSLPDLKAHCADIGGGKIANGVAQALKKPTSLGRALSFTEGSRRKRGTLSHHKSLEVLIHQPNGLLPTIPELHSPAPVSSAETISRLKILENPDQTSSL